LNEIDESLHSDLCICNIQFNIRNRKQFHHSLRWCTVRKEGINIGNMANTDHGISAELGMIGNKKDLPGTGNDGLTYPYFAVIKIKKHALSIYPADADDPKIYTELFDKINGCFPGDTPVSSSNVSSCHNNFKVAFFAQYAGRTQVVGDNSESFVIRKSLGHFFGSGANINKERCLVRNVL